MTQHPQQQIILKKKKKKREAEEEGEPEFQVAPMIDVLLVLLMFFMANVTTDIIAQDADLKLPDASESKEESEKSSQMVVNIEKNALGGTPNIKVDGGNYSKASEITPLIKASKEAYLAQPNADPTKFRVVIRADENTSYKIVSQAMDASAAAGVFNVSFAVNDTQDIE